MADQDGKSKGNSDGQGLAGQLYDGSASLGKISAYIGMVFAIIIGLVLIYTGNKMQKEGEKLTAETEGVINDSECQVITSGTGRRITSRRACFTMVDYTINGKKYKQEFEFPSKKVKGEKIKLYYDPEKPEEPDLNKDSKKTIGKGFIICAIFIIVGAGVHLYITKKSKMYAAASGVGTVGRTVFGGTGDNW